MYPFVVAWGIPTSTSLQLKYCGRSCWIPSVSQRVLVNFIPAPHSIPRSNSNHHGITLAISWIVVYISYLTCKIVAWSLRLPGMQFMTSWRRARTVVIRLYQHDILIWFCLWSNMALRFASKGLRKLVFQISLLTLFNECNASTETGVGDLIPYWRCSMNVYNSLTGVVDLTLWRSSMSVIVSQGSGIWSLFEES